MLAKTITIVKCQLVIVNLICKPFSIISFSNKVFGSPDLGELCNQEKNIFKEVHDHTSPAKLMVEGPVNQLLTVDIFHLEDRRGLSSDIHILLSTG